jgi:septal ring factor EnvC (AmiA/AmiB activator)
MQLEKVTSRSDQSAVVGWISSNDVALFMAVVFMAFAIFLHARLSKGARENVQITEENAALAAQLETAGSELDEFQDMLDNTRKSLNLTQEERDRLQQQLVEKLAAIAELNAKLDALFDEKGKLERQRRTLVEAQETLSKEKAELLTRQSALAGVRDSLQKSNLSLREQLDLIASQLQEKLAKLEEVEQQRNHLKEQADELDSIVAALKRRLETLNIDLAEAKTAAATAHTESSSKVQGLKMQLAARDKSIAEYLAKLKRASELFQSLTAEKKQLQRALSEVELQHQKDLLEEARNNRALVGLSGRLDRVAVLFDASGSMRQASSSGRDRWVEAQQIAGTWLKHLNVQQCVLIVYSSDVRTFPEDGSLADLRGAAGQAKRDALLQHVNDVSPAGWTNTYEALRRAYQYDIDAVLLFSDGAPTNPTTNVFDPVAARRIYELCRSRPNIPVHTIGLGNYFDNNTSNFLMSLAAITHGTFRGN